MDYALVTGSTAGIGLAIAVKLLQKGYFVYLNYANNDARAKETERDLAEHGDRFRVIKADMSTIEGVELLTSEVMKDTRELTYLALNSYATDKTGFLDVTPDSWRHVMQTNVDMPFFLMQRLFNNMREKGSVVCVGAMMGIHPHATSISYGVSKAAMHMLCKSMVKIYAPKHITINAVCPGFVETPAQESKEPDHRKRIEDKIALGRFAKPDEIADVCMCALQNGYINGSVIQVCGGYCMQ